MDEDVIFCWACLIFATACLSLVILLGIYFINAKNREIELEKYKIEMQIKHGDVILREN